MVQLSHPYTTTAKTIALTIYTFVSKVLCLPFNTLSRFVIAFLPRSMCLNFMATVTAGILEPKKVKSVTVSIFPPSICHEVMEPASWELCMWVRMQQLKLDMEQWTGSKLEKEHVKAVYCHPAYLTYMQSTLCEMPGWMKHKLEPRLPGEISITSDM